MMKKAMNLYDLVKAKDPDGLVVKAMAERWKIANDIAMAMWPDAPKKDQLWLAGRIA